jgi:hypothetical protein
VATGSVAVAVSGEAWQLAGLWLLVYAAVTYAVAALEGPGWAAATAVLDATVGIALLLLGAKAGASATFLVHQVRALFVLPSPPEAIAWERHERSRVMMADASVSVIIGCPSSTGRLVASVSSEARASPA